MDNWIEVPKDSTTHLREWRLDLSESVRLTASRAVRHEAASPAAYYGHAHINGISVADVEQGTSLDAVLDALLTQCCETFQAALADVHAAARERKLPVTAVLPVQPPSEVWALVDTYYPEEVELGLYASRAGALKALRDTFEKRVAKGGDTGNVEVSLCVVKKDLLP